MSTGTNVYIVGFVCMLLGVGLSLAVLFLRRSMSEQKIKNARAQAKGIIEDAQKAVDALRREGELNAKDLLFKMRQDFEKESRERRDELVNLEKRIAGREANLDRRVDLLEKKERELEDKAKNLKGAEDALKAKNDDLAKVLVEEKERLHKISNMSPEEAKALLLSKLESELTREKAVLIKKAEDDVKESADKKAQELITYAIQRCAVEHAVESTVSVVNLPGDDMKGRIIGREGRNIRAFEMATGIDVIIDDTPEAVMLSGFDPVRREIARISLERLISDGRIHPGRIEELVEKVKKEMDIKIKEEGEKVLFDIGVHGIHPELVKMLGRLKYRTSFGQNALQHSKEVALLMGVLADEVGLDPKLARRIGILHDIGKALDQQIEGTHARLGADLARKFSETDVVVQGIEAHHEEVEKTSLYGVLAAAADAISAARPGARRETLETYVKRLEKLESIANVFNGVEKAFAIQAGREIRIIVQPEKISDSDAVVLARDIRKKIEEGMEYPGQVKVTVIRETRAIEYAK
ncbi:MAG TPA: ribonuclease Y [Candidatus Omnitrophica bacterium]|nr:ribonuclease Y [Candidatus Omnitrophota bacterium]